MGASPLPSAPPPAPTEYQVKAAFLYNFAKFVNWPPDAFKDSGDTFVIGILGTDPFGDAIEAGLKGKTIQGKSLTYKRLSGPEEAAGCHVVFVSESERKGLHEILSTLQKQPILTVSDMKGFAEKGGMIGFVLEQKKVGFHINQAVAEKSGLKISSQLLKLAKNIEVRPVPGDE